MVKETKNKGLLASHRRSKKRQAIIISSLFCLGMELGECLLGAAGVKEYPHGPDLAGARVRSNSVQEVEVRAWARSLRLRGTMYSDVLLAIDGAANRIVAFPNSSTRTAATTSSTGKGITAFQGTPLNAPIGLTLNPLNRDLLVVNQKDNNLVELNLAQSRAVGMRLLDNVPVDGQTGNGSALIGVAAGTDGMGNLEVFFTDDNTNTLDMLSV